MAPAPSSRRSIVPTCSPHEEASAGSGARATKEARRAITRIGRTFRGRRSIVGVARRANRRCRPSPVDARVAPHQRATTTYVAAQQETQVRCAFARVTSRERPESALSRSRPPAWQRKTFFDLRHDAHGTGRRRAVSRSMSRPPKGHLARRFCGSSGPGGPNQPSLSAFSLASRNALRRTVLSSVACWVAL